MNKQVPCTPCKDKKFKARRKKRFFTQEEEQQRRNVMQLIQLKTARKATSCVVLSDEDNISRTDSNFRNTTETEHSNLVLLDNAESLDSKVAVASPESTKPFVIDSPMSLEKKPTNLKNQDQEETVIPASNKENKELKTLARRLSFLSPFRNFPSENTEDKDLMYDQTSFNESYCFHFLEDKRMKSFASSFDASTSSYLDASVDNSMRLIPMLYRTFNPFISLVDGEGSDESCCGLDEGAQKQRSSSVVIDETQQFLSFGTLENGQCSSFDGNPKRLQQVLQLSRYTRDFEELGVLGSGSFGKVYKCRARLDGCLYAIKLISRKYASLCERNRAIKEIHALAAFSKCPSFVRYYTSWEEDNMLYIQMEYCQHGSVMSLWKDEKLIFKTAELVNFLQQVLQGLCYLHDRQVVHLDIKPENIYLTHDGLYKIGDLGLVTCVPDEKQECSNIGKDVFEGDSRYLSLELLQEDYKDLKKADIFSLGLSAYELARTANKPLPSTGEAWHKIRSSQLEPLTTISPSLFELLQWMTRKDPEQRPCARAALVYLEKISAKELYEH
ncbi:wee1-like protein kinase [Galdieria sulphuraria]|uniref:Wee1-like protein kinase n=1 Tax=Galdieria sulphuraria TaxID=130081 RepID=M2X7M3_GALSU|nr:wee1-like protein kinase [Galdieria sulphuraria]EME32525.1 wee1-like protein kinase [Galdieria sulphuraria]|eukprot:XP_005709045.1 wee1-like protein kinase [Galdieria sulphuraria]